MALELPTIDVTAGAGEPLPSGGAKLNAAMRALETAMPHAPVTRIIIEGDSIGGDMANLATDSPLQWADTLYQLGFTFNKATDNFAIGGTQTTNLASPPGMTTDGRLSAIATRIREARSNKERVICILQAGTNDVGLGIGDNAAGGTVANIQKITANMFAAGASHVVVMSIDPRTGTTADQSRNVLGVNLGLGQLCRSQPERMTFCDTQFATGDDSTALFLPQGLDGTYGVHRDQLHPAARGAFYKARVLGPILQRLVPRRRSLITLSASAQSTTSPPSLRGNLLRRQGRFYDTGAGTGQTDGITVADTATVTGKANLPSAKLGSTYPGYSSALTGTQTLEISQQPYPPIVEALGRTDILCTRLRFAGVPTASNAFNVSMIENTLAAYDVTAGPYETEIMMYMQGVKGLRGVGYNFNADSAGGGGYGGGFTATAAAAKVMQDVTGQINMRGPAPLTATGKPGNVSIIMGFGWNANVEFAGDIYLFGAAIVQAITMVSATA